MILIIDTEDSFDMTRNVCKAPPYYLFWPDTVQFYKKQKDFKPPRLSRNRKETGFKTGQRFVFLSGATVLHLASSGNHAKLVETLLERDADPNKKDWE